MRHLFYDNLIRGAGLGHTFGNYNHGVKLSQELGVEFLPDLLRLGHARYHLEQVERFLGLPLATDRRNHLLKDSPHLIHHCKLKEENPLLCEGALINSGQPLLPFYDHTKNFYLKGFREHRSLTFPSLLKEGHTNICISIRRGDIFLHPGFKPRILPDSYYRNILAATIEHLNLKQLNIIVFSDGDHGNNYLNHNGEPTSLREVFHGFEITTVLGQSSAELTLQTFQNCVESEIFICSLSGFSEIITLYRNGLTVLPPGEFLCHNNEVLKSSPRGQLILD